MKEYRIPLVWQMSGYVTVKANSIEEAKALAIGPAPLPEESYYLEDSALIDEEGEIEVCELE